MTLFFLALFGQQFYYTTVADAMIISKIQCVKTVLDLILHSAFQTIFSYFLVFLLHGHGWLLAAPGYWRPR